MNSEPIVYAVRFRNGKFYSSSEGIKIFESYQQAVKFFNKEHITEKFDLIDDKEIIYETKEKNNHKQLCLIWSKTKETIWEHIK